MSDWTPSDYLAFADERARPARDLLMQVPLVAARRVFDLGCGPGNATALLVKRFPGAAITGIDNSPAMLEAARKACPGAAFAAGDLARWMPDGEPDLIFSNAAFHWVPDHLGALERLARCLPGGASLSLAVDGKEHAFAFDRVFPPSATQSEVFGAVSELVQCALDGYHVCLFSYGQTGAGKTHTMQGGAGEAAGIIPRAVQQVCVWGRCVVRVVCRRCALVGVVPA